jgi:hypothetical protein
MHDRICVRNTSSLLSNKTHKKWFLESSIFSTRLYKGYIIHLVKKFPCVIYFWHAKLFVMGVP